MATETCADVAITEDPYRLLDIDSCLICGSGADLFCHMCTPCGEAGAPWGGRFTYRRSIEQSAALRARIENNLGIKRYQGDTEVADYTGDFKRFMRALARYSERDRVPGDPEGDCICTPQERRDRAARGRRRADNRGMHLLEYESYLGDACKLCRLQFWHFVLGRDEDRRYGLPTGTIFERQQQVILSRKEADLDGLDVSAIVARKLAGKEST